MLKKSHMLQVLQLWIQFHVKKKERKRVAVVNPAIKCYHSANKLTFWFNSISWVHHSSWIWNERNVLTCRRCAAVICIQHIGAGPTFASPRCKCSVIPFHLFWNDICKWTSAAAGCLTRYEGFLHSVETQTGTKPAVLSYKPLIACYQISHVVVSLT